MNERIRELEKQSYVDADVGDGVYQKFSTEKFAELIVRECMDLNNQFVGRRIGEIDLDVVYKEHFGVE